MELSENHWCGCRAYVNLITYAVSLSVAVGGWPAPLRHLADEAVDSCGAVDAHIPKATSRGASHSIGITQAGGGAFPLWWLLLPYQSIGLSDGVGEQGDGEAALFEQLMDEVGAVVLVVERFSIRCK